MAFEYRYRFSVEEEIISRYDCSGWYESKFIFETTTNFLVKGRFDVNGGGSVEKKIDWERFELHCSEEYLQNFMATRLRDYWMPDHEIQRLINQLLLFAEQIAAGGRRGRVPVAIDVDVCTVQGEGEAIEETADRAMRPEYLPPLYLRPGNDSANRKQPPEGCRANSGLVDFLRRKVPAIRVEDVEEGLHVMEVCGVCGRRPIVGTQISVLRCGHGCHYHCIVRRLEGGDNSCPICLLRLGDIDIDDSDHDSGHDCGFVIDTDTGDDSGEDSDENDHDSDELSD
ncbi:hypothetical protein C2S52_000280 [Perilla frutescens var. hirtella]|nr:hypothetical protein C2S52_000280 [Perilla frutescens var. hirtella]